MKTPADPAWLYLHGFASSPQSSKALSFQAWGNERRVSIEALDLRVPSFEHLRFSAMKARVRDAIGGPRGRAVLIGSSLGGLTACRVAEEDPRVCAILAMAPAFRLAERWRARLGPEAWDAWRRDGVLDVEDHATKQTGRVDFAFVEELETLDAGWPDVRVPVLVVHGHRDDVVAIEGSRQWARGRRNVRVVEVDDDHLLARSIPHILSEADRFFAPFLTGSGNA